MKLRKVPLVEFTIDDVRFMIGQEIGLQFVLFMAIEILRENLLAEGNYYEGDVLNSILNIKPRNWIQLQDYWLEVDALIKGNLVALNEVRPKLDIENFYLAQNKVLK